MTFLAGLAALGLLFYLYQLWKGGKPQDKVQKVTSYGGYACLAGGAGLLASGRVGAGAILMIAGLALIGRSGGTFRSLFSGMFGSADAQIRAPMVELTMNRRTGALTGRILAGAHAGTALERLTVEQVAALRAGLDAQSADLVEAYLDRRAPGWRQNTEGDAGGRSRRSAPGRGAMTEEEAYEVLGLKPGATEAQVRTVHRNLMKKIHPDHGGSDYLAARVNQAKDVILSKHR
ncbi:MAG: hypothetical protein B7Y75_01165 [Azorhizobium sp. 35-67-5]|nr:MAG: hypothetical protein B7Y75_01165 [Azorhizobium sp. 35-67-5]